MPRAGSAAHSRPSDERTSFVDAHGHAWVRLEKVEWLVLAEPGLAALPVASALGWVAVEGAPDSVHRRRGGGAVPVLGPVHGGLVVVRRQLSLLVGVQYIDKCRCTCVMQWQVRCMVLFCAMPGSTANACSATALGALAVLLLFST